MNGAPARTTAATSPVASEPATIQPTLPLGPGPGWDGWSRPVSLGVGSVATMDSIPCTVRRRTFGTCRQRDTRRRSLILIARGGAEGAASITPRLVPEVARGSCAGRLGSGQAGLDR